MEDGAQVMSLYNWPYNTRGSGYFSTTKLFTDQKGINLDIKGTVENLY